MAGQPLQEESPDKSVQIAFMRQDDIRLGQ
jgi:hypothetical protein